MVSSATLSKACTSTASLETEIEDDFDTVSIRTSSSEAVNNAVVLYDEAPKDQLAFGNVAITNSSDVHFGNKTYYQGPVTIKQFLYASNADAGLKELESKLGDVKCANGTVIEGLEEEDESDVQNGGCKGVVAEERITSDSAAGKPEMSAAAENGNVINNVKKTISIKLISNSRLIITTQLDENLKTFFSLNTQGY